MKHRKKVWGIYYRTFLKARHEIMPSHKEPTIAEATNFLAARHGRRGIQVKLIEEIG